jgi:uncharacterized protein YecE (DUF72 family)
MNSIEINGASYSPLRSPGYRASYESTPDGFRFSLKAGRLITHLKRLVDVELPLADLFASGILGLEEKLGPIVWQMPPAFRYAPARLEKFFRLLPRNTEDAFALARKHEKHTRPRASSCMDTVMPLRHAMEVRHDSFQTPEFIELLRAHEIALVVADTAGKWPFMEDITSDFVYVRLHGDEELYAGGYTDSALDYWAKKVRAWAAGNQPGDAKLLTAPAEARISGRDVFVYFDNDVRVRSPHDAMSLSHRLGLRPPPPKAPELEDARDAPSTLWQALSASLGGMRGKRE